MRRGYPRFLYTAATASPAANTTALAMRGNQALAFCVTLAVTALSLLPGKVSLVLLLGISGGWPIELLSVGGWDDGEVPWEISPEDSVALCPGKVSRSVGSSGMFSSGKLSAPVGSSAVLSDSSEISVPLSDALASSVLPEARS